MPEPFGSFGWICRHTVLPQCNLFFSQLYDRDSLFLSTLFPQDADFFSRYGVTSTSARDDTPVQQARGDAGNGLGANCEIAHVGHRGSVGDVALIVLSAVSMFMAFGLTWLAGRRKAAVGRQELRILLVMFGIHSAFQIVTMSSLLEQGSDVLSVVSSIHIAVVVTLFWILLGNALIATQIVEDGTPAALVPLIIVAVLFFVPPLYISLDTAFQWTGTFQFSTSDVPDLKAIALFILTVIWPAVAAVGYLLTMLYVVLGVLREIKPAIFYLIASAMFAAAQIIFFLASQPLCDAANGKINSAFLTTLLNAGAVGMIYYAWKTITEEDWGEEYGTY